MYNADILSKYTLPAPPPRAATLVDKANEAVDIRDILRPMGIWCPDGEFYSYKIDCPWAYEHEDGGRDKNCRLFGSTNVYCWWHELFITPVYLYSRWKGIPQMVAAETLLGERNLLSKPWRERWADLVQQRDDSLSVKLGSKNDLIKAMHIALEADDVYIQQEFSSNVRAGWQKVLEKLDKMWVDEATTLEQVNDFFSASLAVLHRFAELDEAEQL